jgi:hypothetical protein
MNWFFRHTYDVIWLLYGKRKGCLHNCVTSYKIKGLFSLYFSKQYMTDGMLLREFLGEPDLASYR